jgi:uncharacterized protein
MLKPRGMMYLMLWIAALLSLRWLLKQGYNFKLDWNWPAFDKAALIRLLFRFIPLCIALIIFTFLVIPENLFGLPRNRPNVWVLVMIFYPLLSVVPQEVVFRSFFFRRYATLFPDPRMMILASSFAFGWVHILLLNWVAVAFSAVGGILFAHTYHKTRSLAAACFEHALYGCFIFTLGLGYFFYHGHAVR